MILIKNKNTYYLKELKIKQMELNHQNILSNYNFYKEYYREFYNKDVDVFLKQEAESIDVLKNLNDEKELKRFIGLQKMAFGRLLPN